MKILLKKDLLHDDQMYGKGSVIDMWDVGRLNFLLKMGHADIAGLSDELTHKPPPLPKQRSVQANELAEVLTEALKGVKPAA